MNELDDRLKEALGEDAPPEGEIGILKEVGEVFRGPHKLLVWIAAVFATVFTFGFFYCGWKFFTVEGVESMLSWGFGCVMLFMATQALKLWHWMEMNKNRVLREVKRLELQVARLRDANGRS